MKKNDAGRGKSWVMFRSWLMGLVFFSLPFGFVGLVCFRQLDELDPVRCLQWTALFLVAYTAGWMVLGAVTLIEGQFMFAEYGGHGNRLRRLHFRDGRVWTFSEPLNIRLWSGPKPGCVLDVAVRENFLGRVSILYRMVNCYNGENEWFDDEC